MLLHSQHFLGQLLLGLLCFCISPAQGDYFTNPASFELDQAGAQITTQNLNTTYTLGEKVQLTWVVPNVPYISLVLVRWGKDEGVPVASFITANDRNNGYYTWFVGESDGLTEGSINNNPNFALRIVDPTGNYTKTGDPPGFIDNELQSRGFVIKSKAETGPKASSANLSIGAVAGIAIGSFAVGALVVLAVWWLWLRKGRYHSSHDDVRHHMAPAMRHDSAYASPNSSGDHMFQAHNPHGSSHLSHQVSNISPVSPPEMKIDPARAKALVSQLQAVQERVTAVAAGRNVRLVAVSKLKPANDVLALHQATPPQLHFGENYAQELGQKAELLPRSIQWHFIGGLQSTHAKKLAKIPNLFCVSSVDTLKKAQLLNTSRAELIAASPDAEPLGIHVQVNTSGEESKSGASPGEETVALCRAVENDCPSLRLLGLMTIGAIARSKATTPENENEDFLCLREQRDLVAKELGLDRELELSMGMSEDFEGAVRLGSGEVRVGSTIFGERGPKNEAKVVV
ncbi:hypothetical protein K4K54_001295 [Colletotrichum sp. SAR 10_86]|nr:hypothetical protein KHU50_001042 [Colletotrichum sp. SAR 10_65]KAI8229684.1 hypothetical protein K4K54_001295 [Colletotrichum sp. SAR 10_86]KAJ5007147.1 hypothetical protein K4K48_001050 [Colletotrichum sp. SAR 10_66]